MSDPSLELHPVSLLHECVTLDHDTGVLTWKRRPIDHFPNSQAWQLFNTRYAGTRAGAKMRHGYRALKLSIGGIRHWTIEHRAIFAMATGAWPVGEIDHRNLIRNDNRPSNLRDSSHAENQHNTPRRRDNASGHKGVHWHSASGKWVGQISKNRVVVVVGYFDDLKKAVDAVSAARFELHEAFARSE